MPSAFNRIIFDKTAIPRLSTVLDLAATRQKLLTKNVANAETPGYARQDINFEAELKAAMDRKPSTGMKATRPGHIGAGSAGSSPHRIVREAVPRDETSAVQLDQEMARAVQNQLEYTIAAQLVRGKFDGLKTAIRGGR